MSTRRTAAQAQPPQPWVKTGAGALAALEQAEKEAKERAERGFMPFRFWLAKGEECEIIILDDTFVSDEPGIGGALVKEHNLKGADGKWGVFESCCSDFAPCALCDRAGTEGFGNSTPAVMLSIIANRPWESKKTGEKHTYSKMLLPVRLAQKGMFLDLQKHAIREQGSMRGMVLVMRRGTGDQSVATGEPVMLDNGKLYDFISEEDLVAEYGHDEVRSRDNKIIKKADDDIEPFDYDKLFPRPDPDALAKRFGGRALAGSRRAAAKDWDAEQGASEGEAEPQEAAPTTTGRRSRAAASAPVEPAAPATPVARRRSSAAAQTETAPPQAASAPVRRRGGSANASQQSGAAW